MNDIERLTLAQAIYSELGKIVSTKDPESLRSKIDEQYRELYESTGSKSYDVKLNDNIVGTYSIRFSKSKDSESRDVFEVRDYEALAKWFEGVDASIISSYVAHDLAQFAEWYMAETGEMPDGCNMSTVVTPAVEKHYMGGALRVDSQSVLEAMNDALPYFVAGLLEGGDE